MGFLSRLKTLGQALVARHGGATDEERLSSYYRRQADSYDEFREFLLLGRRRLLAELPWRDGIHVLDLGAGTGWNAEQLGERLKQCASYTMVDLCPPLMAVAQRRIERHGWPNVKLVHADAAEYIPEAPVDIIICSYVLTMMPRWYAVLDHAAKLLRPGGVLGVTDFYVSAKHSPEGHRQHSAWSRWFWQACFAWHHVYLHADHLPYLEHRFATEFLLETTGRMPFMAGMKSPYYVFVGRKKEIEPSAVIDRPEEGV